MTEGRPGEARRIRRRLHRQGAVDASESGEQRGVAA